MTDRTKLDEIAQEELQSLQGSFGGEFPWASLAAKVSSCCTRIAEKAFRHGVEQTGKYANCSVIYGDLKREVQPAPAATAQERVHEAQLRYEAERLGTMPSRRRGERRKGMEAVNWVHDAKGNLDMTRKIVQTNDHGSFQYDRRVLPDRRKPQTGGCL